MFSTGHFGYETVLFQVNEHLFTAYISFHHTTSHPMYFMTNHFHCYHHFHLSNNRNLMPFVWSYTSKFTVK